MTTQLKGAQSTSHVPDLDAHAHGVHGAHNLEHLRCTYVI